jgi:DNA-binding NtrC family response regulator
MSLLRRIVVISRKAEIQQLARQVSHEVFVADDLAEAPGIIETVSPDLIVFDDKFNPSHIQEFLITTDKNSVNVPVVVVGNGESDTNISAQFIQAGAYDYLPSKQHYDELIQIAHRIKNRSEISTAEKDISDFFVDECAASLRMVGRSRAFTKTLGMIRLVAASQCNPVLIIGETGTGKELAAEAIHSLRHPNEELVAVNCATLTASLLESELFGHVKGSFTGADRDKTGLLELAGTGTIFLDEISEMPLDLQAKLLRVLQERTFRKVGGIKNITCSATIIASSNRNLYKEMKAHRFRRDLYYRLNICPVIIAPLKSPDRREDIPLLAEYFLNTSAICPEKNKRITSLTKFALEALQKHDWPGNIRELRNVIDRAILFETTDKIGLNSIVFDPTECASAEPTEVEQSPEGLPAGAGQCPPGQTHIKDFSLAKAERELVVRALRETGWQKTQAAALLGITRTTLYAKVKQYNIKKDSQTHPSRQVADGLREHVPTPFSPAMAN